MDGDGGWNEKYNLYYKKFNPHRLANGDKKAKEGLCFLLPDVIALISISSAHYLSPSESQNRMVLYNRPRFFTQPGAHDHYHQPVAVVAVDNLQGKEDSTEACCNSKIHQQCDYLQVSILVL